LHFISPKNRIVEELTNFAILKKIVDKVIVHGELYDVELDNIIKKCHVGIATLAFHKYFMFATSVLKIRDYVARGLLFIFFW
jgi:hypothetical protein